MDEPMKLLVDVESGEQSMVPLTPDEIAQREADQADAEAQAAAEAQAQVDRDALLAKLTSGTASPQELQQALAQLLG